MNHKLVRIAFMHKKTLVILFILGGALLFLAYASERITSAAISSQCPDSTCTSLPGPAILGEVLGTILYLAGGVLFTIVWISILIKQAQRQQWTWFVLTLFFNWIPMLFYLIKVPETPQKELQPSPDGQQQPPWSQQSATPYGQPQQFSPYDQQQPQWEQQLSPPYGQPFSSQPQYGVSPSPDFGQSQQPKKRSRRRLWITLAVLEGIVALSMVASTLYVALSVGSLPRLARPSLRSGLRVLLVPATGTDTTTPAALSATQMLLSERLAAYGFKNASVQVLTSGSQPTLQVEVPHFGGDERATLDILLNTGTVEFWNTGPSPVGLGLRFDPTQFTQYNPGDKPQFTGTDLDSSQVYVSQDEAGRPQISFEMKGDAISRFGTFTASNVGQYLTVTLDLRWTSPDPGFGPMVKLRRGKTGCLLNLLSSGKALPGKCIAAKKPPPALLQIEPARSCRNEDVMEARMRFQPGARLQAVVAREIIGNQEKVACRILRFNGGQQGYCCVP